MEQELLQNRLRLLLINDAENVNIATKLVEVVTVPNKYEKPSFIDRLASWTQHMCLWSDDVMPGFDLLLIDINFFHDPNAPKYGIDIGAQERDFMVSPFGLLHALPLAALQRSTKMPFSWQIHSGNPKAVASDPVAQWAFGMLLAMQGDAQWVNFRDSNPDSTIADYFGDRLKELVAMDPDEAWPMMVDDYRNRLLDACANYVEVDSGQLKRCIEMARDRTASNIESLARVSLCFYVDGKPEHRSLRSLFAEENWNQSAVENVVLPFLEKLYEIDTNDSLYNDVLSTMNKLKENKGIVRVNITNATRDFGDEKHRIMVRLGTVVFLYLEYYEANGKGPTATWLIDALGYDEPADNFNRLIEILDAADMGSPKKFLDSLRSRPLVHPPLRRAARLHWERLGGPKKNKSSLKIPMPKCIQRPESHTDLTHSNNRPSFSGPQ